MLSGPTPIFKVVIVHENPGRIAQRESVPFTRERSKVRSLVRPPSSSMKSNTFLDRPTVSLVADWHLHAEQHEMACSRVQNPCSPFLRCSYSDRVLSVFNPQCPSLNPAVS